MFQISTACTQAYPDAHAGVLVMLAVTNPARHAALDERKAFIEAQLRTRFGGQDRRAIESLPVIQAYNAYYKRFNKTYHVQLQLESIAFKGKAIPSVAALVEAMFMAEVQNMLLTAGHDYDKLQLPITLDVAKGDERYTLLRGQEQVLKPGDMFMADTAGVISSILYGPDQRTQITEATKNVVFTVYAPAGIGEETVLEHLREIQRNVQTVAPDAKLEPIAVYGGHGGPAA
jgi:DNA/RNA-binding domain of Phe-tRNA-synthetase-like protein